MKKLRIILIAALISLIICVLVLANINLTYKMSAPTQTQAIGLFVDQGHTKEISPDGFYWGSQGLLISNGTMINCYAFNSGNVALNVTIVPVSSTSCTVTYLPTGYFPIANGTTVEIQMTFNDVTSNTTASWSFYLNATAI